MDANGDERKVSYLATLSKHSQAVNVVRWAPKGIFDPSMSFAMQLTALR